MIWAQFYKLIDGKYHEGVGDRQLVILDGRWSKDNRREVAVREGKKRGYDGYAIYRGESFTRGFCLELPKAL